MLEIFCIRSIRKDRTRRRRAMTILSVLLVLAVLAAAFALVQQRAAEHRRELPSSSFELRPHAS